MIDVIYRYDPDSSPNAIPPATPQEAIERLREGNLEFAHLLDPSMASACGSRVIPFDLPEFGLGESKGRAPTQSPYAVVLGCSDARVPTELIFNQACNALFVVRVAGNVLGSECLGSVDYAVSNLDESVKLLVVLGHSGCGAVTAAVDAFLEPTQYLSVGSCHPVRAILDRLFVSVRSAAKSLGEIHGGSVETMPGYRAALIETAVTLNAALTASALRQEYKSFHEDQLKIVFGVYDLVTRKVGLPGGDDYNRPSGLVDTPATFEQFGTLGRLLVGSTYISQLLRGL